MSDIMSHPAITGDHNPLIAAIKSDSYVPYSLLCRCYEESNFIPNQIIYWDLIPNNLNEDKFVADTTHNLCFI